MLPLLLFLAVATLAATYIAYVLWPRWPGPPVAPNAPPLPIVIGGVAFNIPPGAIRRPVQRRPGSQERVDLIFVWPGLTPPPAATDPGASADSATAEREAAREPERLFVTISDAAGVLSPLDRLKAIYGRYLSHEFLPAPAGLVMFSFRDGSPYQGEDLFYPPEAPERFLLRCNRPAGPTPGTCLHERRVGQADVTIRFPRAWLADWHAVASGIDRLMARLQSAR